MATEDIFVIESNISEIKKDAETQNVNILSILKEAITVEPLVFCHLLSVTLSGHVADLRRNPNNDEVSLQDQTRSLYEHMIYIISSLLVLLLGSFSDTHNVRKPLLLIAMIGQFFKISGLFLNEEIRDMWNIDIVHYVIPIPLFFGGYMITSAIIFAYICDISSSKSRTIRIGIIFILKDLVEMINLSTEDLIQNYPKSVLLLALIINILGVFYGFYFVEEPKRCIEIKNLFDLIKSIFNPRSITDTLKMIVKEPDGKCRSDVLLMLVIVFMCTFVADGESLVHNIYASHIHDTDLLTGVKKYVDTPVRIMGNAVALLLFIELMELTDNTVTILSFINKIMGSFVHITLRTVAGFYAGIVLSIFRGISSVTTCSYLTKTVSENDYGKVCSLYAIITEGIAPILAQLIYKGIFTEEHPTNFFIIGIVLYGFGVFILESIYFKNKKREKLKNEVSEVDENQTAKCSNDAIELTML